MDSPEDELEVRQSRLLKLRPDVYYRCPTLESLDGALQNELQKNAASLIPVEIVTEFVFALASTVTINTAQQTNLTHIGLVPADYPQSITVDQALCRDIHGKERLKAQRAIARSVIDVVQAIDGFKYCERQAFNKEGTDGARFKYVCIDSLQHRDRLSTKKKKKEGAEQSAEVADPKNGQRLRPTYDCGGAIHIKFSTKRDAMNVVYNHNPIHREVESRPAIGQNDDSEIGADVPTEPGKRKRGRPKKSQVVETNGNGLGSTELDMSTSPETTKAPPKKKSRKSKAAASPELAPTPSKKGKKGKQTQSTAKPRSAATAPVPVVPAAPNPVKGPCVRCKEKKIKCNEAKPTCDQCFRGLWQCFYETKKQRTRSRNGCFNCRQRKRKCTEEKPTCAYCLKVDDDCDYP